jgi:hypothetical protein
VTRTLIVLLTATVVSAAPAPKTKEVFFFPTKGGDKREYEVRNGDQASSSFTDLVTKVETADKALHVTVSRDYSDTRPFVTTIAVSADGLFRVAANGKTLDRPVPLFKTPAKVGTKWDAGGDSPVSYEIVKEEDIEVPAGKYKALRVEATYEGKVQTVLWFAPSVGLVKMTNPGSDVSTVLKAFTPGK